VPLACGVGSILDLQSVPYIYKYICLNMGHGEAFVLMCFLKNSSAIKEGLDGAHTMETSYKQELKKSLKQC